MQCQGKRGCPNEGIVEFKVTGEVRGEIETVTALLCVDCAQEALRIAATKLGNTSSLATKATAGLSGPPPTRARRCACPRPERGSFGVCRRCGGEYG